MQKPVLYQLLLGALPLVAGILLCFMNPTRLDATDLTAIALDPGRELLTTGSVYGRYPYPIWTVVVMLPLAVWPAHTAMLLWFLCNIIMLAASLAILASLFDWKISPFTYALLVSISTIFLPVLTSIWLGQLTIFSLFMLVLTTSLFLKKRWTWLGIVLGLSFIKPQIMLLLAGLLLLWALWHRRWQVLLGCGAVIVLLVLISLPFVSGPGQILGGGIGYHLATYIEQTSTLWGLLLRLGLPWLVPLLICLGLLIWVGWIWLPTLRMPEIPSNRVLYLFSAATLVNLIAIPYSWMHNLSLLLLPLGYCTTIVVKVKGRTRIAWLTLLLFFMHPLMLGIFLALSGSDNTQTFQIIPALVLLPVMIFLESRNASPRT
jgi:hypothetical protein